MADKLSYLQQIKKKSSLDRLVYWITERQAIFDRRSNNEKFWTADPILRTYRFCNVHREDDRVTRWIDTHWRKPHADSGDMWHAMIIARLLNWPDTLERIGWPEPWSSSRGRVRRELKSLQASGIKVFTGAYIVSTNGIATDKVSYVLETFDRAWNSSDPPVRDDNLATAFMKLNAMHGLGSFMAGQVIADLKHTPYLADAADWWDWCTPGPGSLRGLARLKFDYTGEERARGHVVDKKTFQQELFKLRLELRKHTDIAVGICLQDLQNCLCEFDKYERVLWNQGKPRALYRSHGG